MIDPNTSSTQLTAMETYAQNAPSEYMIPPGGQPAMEMPEYQNGVVPLDTLPAAWWNWLLYTITEQEKRMVRFFNSIFTEFRNLLTTGGIQSFDETVTTQLVTAIQTIARTPATTAICGAIKAGTAYGTLAVDGTTGVATVNGAGSGQFNTLATDITGAINELDGDIGQEINDRTSADNTLQNNIDGKAPINHAATATTYGKGDATNYGHLKLSDAYNDGTSDKDAGTAVTPKALKDGLDSVLVIQANVPTGTILPFGGASAPTGYLLCDGTAYSRTAYATLFAVIGVSYGTGDGVDTFNVPDFRESVPVGAGQSTNGDIAAHDVYTVGEFKDDSFKSHKHGGATGGESQTHTHGRGSFEITGTGAFITSSNEQLSGAFARESGTGGTNYMNNGDRQRIKFTASAGWSGSSGTESQGHTHSITAEGGTTTHGKQVGVNFIIKY